MVRQTGKLFDKQINGQKNSLTVIQTGKLSRQTGKLLDKQINGQTNR